MAERHIDNEELMVCGGFEKKMTGKNDSYISFVIEICCKQSKEGAF